jgi:hypothetical protein
MVFAEVGLGDLIWTTIWIFFLVMFIWLFISIVGDLFRDDSLSGWGKAGWVIALIVFPLLGSLVYLISRGEGMAERSAAERRMAREQFDAYIRTTASSGDGGPVDDLARLVELKNNGLVTDDEFTAIKARIAGPQPAP